VNGGGGLGGGGLGGGGLGGGGLDEEAISGPERSKLTDGWPIGSARDPWSTLPVKLVHQKL
jgi:hypothetical protein